MKNPETKDSFMLFFSVFDYWGLICSLPKAKFLVMYEYVKCGSAIKNALPEHGMRKRDMVRMGLYFML